MSRSAALAVLAQGVPDVRTRFDKSLDELPAGLAETIRTGWERRTRNNSPLLGEIAPELIADLYGVDHGVLYGLMGPWMDLVTATYLGDDYLDLTPQGSKEAVAAMYLFMRGTGGLYQAVPMTGNALVLFNDGFAVETVAN